MTTPNRKGGRPRVENPKVPYIDRSGERASVVLWACKVCMRQTPPILILKRQRTSTDPNHGQAMSTHIGQNHKEVAADKVLSQSYKWGERRWDEEGESADFKTISESDEEAELSQQ